MSSLLSSMTASSSSLTAAQSPTSINPSSSIAGIPLPSPLLDALPLHMAPTEDPTTNILLLAVPLAIPLVLLSLYPGRALRWFERKRYQYEVTYSLYMLTPTEKFVFSTCILPIMFLVADSILFLFLALVTIAATLYLPASVTNMLKRGWYYIFGDAPDSYSHSLKEMAERSIAVVANLLLRGQASSGVIARDPGDVQAVAP